MKKGDEPMVGLLLGPKPKKKADDTSDPAATAAEAVMAAVKDNDVAALTESLRLFVDACAVPSGDDDEY